MTLYLNSRMNRLVVISYHVPKGYKWSEFLFDFWDFTSLNDLDDEYSTSLYVNHYRHSKIYCNWRVLDRYKGKYNGFGLTKNMVDINFTYQKEMFKCISIFTSNIFLNLKEAHIVWCKIS